jgi:hypothetical protein
MPAIFAVGGAILLVLGGIFLIIGYTGLGVSLMIAGGLCSLGIA